ncbi:MAG: hypothetical protein AAGI51_13025, partial [Pseudomonadota bacterium]
MSLPEPSSQERAAWADYLDEGERLVWTGAPLPGLRANGSDVWPSALGFGFLFFGVLALLGIGEVSGPLPRWGIGWAFMAFGAYTMIGRFFWFAWLRGRTRYALTDRRTVIAVNGLSRSLKSYPYSSSAPLELLDGEPGTVNFATRNVRGRRSVQ